MRFGRGAIVLVPEISLTPQTRGFILRRFQSVAVLHSQMTPAEGISNGKESGMVKSKWWLAPEVLSLHLFLDWESLFWMKNMILLSSRIRNLAIMRGK